MIFSSPEFLLLLFPLYLISCLFFAKLGAFLTISALFYIYTSLEFFLFLLAFIIFIFILSRTIKKTPLFAVIILSPLAYFKYSDWFLGQIGLTGGETLVLPLGISFYTFQLMSFFYETNKKERFLNVLNYVTFFPQLIAGPIVRSNQFLPQKGPAKSLSRRAKFVYFGVTIFAFGLAKKILVADNIGLFLDDFDYYFLSNGAVHLLDIAFAIPSILIHLYFDFSAYSDMAIGLGLMAGYRIPINFKMPLSSVSITSFWQRWHISLTEFFRDYLLNSLLLKSARVERQKLAFSLSIVLYFSILGIWHGAGYNFILFGLLNGIAVLVSYSGMLSRLSRLPKLARMLGLHCIVFLIFVNFRYEIGETWTMAKILLQEIPDISFKHTVVTVKFGITLSLCYLWSIYGFEGYELYRRRSAEDFPDILIRGRQKIVFWVKKTNYIWSPMIFIYALFFAGNSPTFVYFQF